MKCPKCENRHSRKSGMTCSCGYPFLFDPKAGWKLSDGWFGSVLRRASANGTRYYTRSALKAQFVVDYQNRSRKGLWFLVVFLSVWSSVFFGGCASALLGGSWVGFSLGPVAVICGTIALLRADRRKRPSDGELAGWIAEWTRRHGRIPHLLNEPSLEAPPASAQQDVHDYGVECVLVVDEELLVDYLVKNGWAQQNRCLVVAASGYPSHIHALALEFLAERADLPVLLYHHAARLQFRQELVADGWPLADRPLRDLGLTPAQIAKNPWFRRHFPDLPREEMAPDLLPPATLTRVLTATLVAGVAVEAMLDERTQNAFSSSFETDFG